jgi:hypothetical protein
MMKVPSVPQTGDHLRLANIQKKQGMGGLHRRPERPKGNLFMTGGAGRRAKRDNTAGKERVAVPQLT